MADRSRRRGGSPRGATRLARTAGGFTIQLRPTPAATTTVGGTAGVYSWYLQSLVEGWVQGSSTNNGIILRAHTETISNLLRFSLSETSTQNPPKLVVGWVDRTGLRHHFTT